MRTFFRFRFKKSGDSAQGCRPEAASPQIGSRNMNPSEKSAASLGGASSPERENSQALPRVPKRIAVAIVDDNENDLLLITRTVNQSPDLESVGSYSSGVEALNGILFSASDVVLMDVRMPGMSGIESTRQLKIVRPHLLIIMISGFDDPDAAARALEAGADAYLTKPFSLGQFFEILGDCLQRRKLRADRDTGSAPVQSTQQGLLAEDPVVRAALHRLVMRMDGNPHTREDLFQEAWSCFWSREQQYPGRPLGWYLQWVKFHLKNLGKSGRSLDSSKRRAAQAGLADNGDRPNEPLDPFELGDGIMSEINARDIRSVLIDRLEPVDQTILVALEEGWASRAVAKRLQLSHESVRRHRLKIAAAALKLGIVPLIPSPDHRSHPL